jgi:hypothetical protein
LDTNLFIPVNLLVNHEIVKLNAENFHDFGKSYCEYCPGLKTVKKSTSAYSKHVQRQHSNHFEESIQKYFEDADSLSDEDVRDAIEAMHLDLIGQDEYVIFLDEGLKVFSSSISV